MFLQDRCEDDAAQTWELLRPACNARSGFHLDSTPYKILSVAASMAKVLQLFVLPVSGSHRSAGRDQTFWSACSLLWLSLVRSGYLVGGLLRPSYQLVVGPSQVLHGVPRPGRSAESGFNPECQVWEIRDLSKDLIHGTQTYDLHAAARPAAGPAWLPTYQAGVGLRSWLGHQRTSCTSSCPCGLTSASRRHSCSCLHPR